VVNEGLPAAIVKEAKQDSVSGFEPNEQVATETKAMVNRLQELYTFRFNEVMGCTEYRPRDERTDFRMADRSAMSDMALQLRLDGIDARENDVRRFLESSMISHFDPLDEYLWKVHDKWDGKDHIGALARTVKTDNPHWEEWFRRWFVAMVAQWRGGKLRRYGNAYMPLLISRQGYNKSTFCKSLIPEELQWGYTPSLSLQEKRPVLQAMSQFLLINLDEFNSIPVNIQQGFLKNIVSLSSVKVKRPYGRRMEDFPRLASFIATANMTDLLADPSGSRRFLSVELTGPIDVSNVPYHEQLYAQAQALIDSGYRYWFTKEEEREIMENNRQFQLRSPAEELLNEYFEITYDENEGTYLSPSAIFTYLKEKAGSSLRVTNIRSLGRMLANMEGIRRRRVNAGTQYLLKKRPK
jgi:predicted P-loop ATPase